MPVIVVYGAAFRGMEYSLSRVSELKAALRKAVLSVEELGISSEQCVSVFCPKDGEYQSEVRGLIIEVHGLFVGSGRSNAVCAKLAAGLGYAALTIYPGIFVECFITPFDLRQGFWVSTNVVTRQEISLLLEKLPPLVNMARQSVKGGCYCESNALDHKGPCHHCNIFGTYRGFLEEAERVAALADESDFRVQADVLAARCRRESLLKEVCAQIGWLNQNVE